VIIGYLDIRDIRDYWISGVWERPSHPSRLLYWWSQSSSQRSQR